MVENRRLVFEGEYVSVKSKKGFRGNWHSHYTVRNIKAVTDEDIFIDSYVFVGLKSFKGKRYKLGDTLRFKASYAIVDGKDTIKYIKDVEKIG